MEKTKAKKLSLKRQNYLETIHKLCQEQEHAHIKAIADRLEIRMPSVTETIQALAKQGLINYNVRKAVTLTEAGKKIAMELEDRHQVLEEFFCLLGCSTAKAAKIACLVEHNIDNDIATRMSHLVKLLKNDYSQNGTLPLTEPQQPSPRKKSR